MAQDTITSYNANGAIPPASGVAKLTKAGVGALTLLTPGASATSLQLDIISLSDYEQVVTGVFLDGGVYTELRFSKRGFVRLRSDGDDWYVVSKNRNVNLDGVGDNTVDLSPVLPTAPTIGAATAGAAQGTVAYTLGNNGGSAILSVIATFTPVSGDPVESAPTLANPITVTGLANDVAGTFKVRAANVLGYSAESGASNSITPTA